MSENWMKKKKKKNIKIKLKKKSQWDVVKYKIKGSSKLIEVISIN